MIEISYSDIVTDKLMEGAYLHDAHTGFLQDYSVLNCLIRIHKPKTIWETGTNTGEGINVMATALPDAKIYSLDLPFETMIKNSKQYPIDGRGNDRVGSACLFPYTQIRGDSLTFDYSKYPCEAAWVDGEHTTQFVEHETRQLIKNKTKLIIYHDCDDEKVLQGVINGMTKSYKLYRVTGTRIAYLLKK